jgi:hypothetical protein
MRRLLLSLLLVAACPALAQVYTYIDAEGNRVFTDQPKAGNAKHVQMAPTNGMAQTTPRGPAEKAAPAAVVPPSYQLLRILVPEPDAVLNDGTGDIIVSATSEPALLPAHNYRLIVDGQPAGEPARSPVFPLQGLARGTHQLAVEILDAEGRMLERTPSQPLHVRLTSLDQKRKARPCKLKDYGVRPECPLKDKPIKPRDIPYVPFI